MVEEYNDVLEATCHVPPIYLTLYIETLTAHIQILGKWSGQPWYLAHLSMTVTPYYMLCSWLVAAGIVLLCLVVFLRFYITLFGMHASRGGVGGGMLISNAHALHGGLSDGKFP